jgi:large subunit ribosomal protein L18
MATRTVEKRNRIRRRIRAKVMGTSECPRLAVFKSNKQIYAQLIDDQAGLTLASASSINIKEAQGIKKVDQAKVVGAKVAENAKAAGIERVVFDRGGYLYHGRVKSLAESARENGLQF